MPVIDEFHENGSLKTRTVTGKEDLFAMFFEEELGVYCTKRNTTHLATNVPIFLKLKAVENAQRVMIRSCVDKKGTRGINSCYFQYTTCQSDSQECKVKLEDIESISQIYEEAKSKLVIDLGLDDDMKNKLSGFCQSMVFDVGMQDGVMKIFEGARVGSEEAWVEINNPGVFCQIGNSDRDYCCYLDLREKLKEFSSGKDRKLLERDSENIPKAFFYKGGGANIDGLNFNGPYVLKPNNESLTKGVIVLKDRGELNNFLAYPADYKDANRESYWNTENIREGFIVQEFVEGNIIEGKTATHRVACKVQIDENGIMTIFGLGSYTKLACDEKQEGSLDVRQVVSGITSDCVRVTDPAIERSICKHTANFVASVVLEHIKSLLVPNTSLFAYEQYCENMLCKIL